MEIIKTFDSNDYLIQRKYLFKFNDLSKLVLMLIIFLNLINLYLIIKLISNNKNLIKEYRKILKFKVNLTKYSNENEALDVKRLSSFDFSFPPIETIDGYMVENILKFIPTFMNKGHYFPFYLISYYFIFIWLLNIKKINKMKPFYLIHEIV